MKDLILLIAGPCAIESRNQISESYSFLAGLGIKLVRAGAYKPRTASASFQGLGEIGLQIARIEADLHGLQIVSELTDISQAGLFRELVDVVQIGARNMQNYELLKQLGSHGLKNKPIILKRGLAATLKEWWLAAEYIRSYGCGIPILCERGHRTVMGHVRFMLDLAAIQLSQEEGFKVIVDPSHAAGTRKLVKSLSAASLAAGADGLMIEVHPDPESALSDNEQQLTHDQFQALIQDLHISLKDPVYSIDVAGIDYAGDR
jgi:3-deoxy-7-phosphoheptulonate synthase